MPAAPGGSASTGPGCLGPPACPLVGPAACARACLSVRTLCVHAARVCRALAFSASASGSLLLASSPLPASLSESHNGVAHGVRPAGSKGGRPLTHAGGLAVQRVHAACGRAGTDLAGARRVQHRGLRGVVRLLACCLLAVLLAWALQRCRCLGGACCVLRAPVARRARVPGWARRAPCLPRALAGPGGTAQQRAGAAPPFVQRCSIASVLPRPLPRLAPVLCCTALGKDANCSRRTMATLAATRSIKGHGGPARARAHCGTASPHTYLLRPQGRPACPVLCSPCAMLCCWVTRLPLLFSLGVRQPTQHLPQQNCAHNHARARRADSSRCRCIASTGFVPHLPAPIVVAPGRMPLPM